MPVVPHIVMALTSKLLSASDLVATLWISCTWWKYSLHFKVRSNSGQLTQFDYFLENEELEAKNGTQGSGTESLSV